MTGPLFAMPYNSAFVVSWPYNRLIVLYIFDFLFNLNVEMEDDIHGEGKLIITLYYVVIELPLMYVRQIVVYSIYL